MIFLRALWGRIWPYIAAAGAVLAGLAAVRQSGKSSGRAEAEREQHAAASEQRRKINEADTKLVEMDDDDVRRRLSEWVRPTDSEDR